MTTPESTSKRSPSNDLLRARVVAALAHQPWWRPAWSTVLVVDGVVRFLGYVAAEWERPLARSIAEEIPGVRAVVDGRARLARWATLL